MNQPNQSGDDADAFTQPTVSEKPTITIDTKVLTSSDLEALKKSDAFMYHSIQFARRRSEVQEADSSKDAAEESKESKESSNSNVVTRRTRLSWEKYSDHELEDVFDEMTPREESDAATEQATRQDLFDELLSQVLIDSSDNATEPVHKRRI
jgi:hypothetical protein